MGSPLVPLISNIFTNWLEEEIHLLGIKFGLPRGIEEMFDFPSPRKSTTDLVKFIFFYFLCTKWYYTDLGKKLLKF